MSALYNPEVPAVGSLSAHTGVPYSKAYESQPLYPGDTSFSRREAVNPLDFLKYGPTLTTTLRTQGRSGLNVNRGYPKEYIGRLGFDRLLPENAAERMKAINRILGRSAIARRN